MRILGIESSCDETAAAIVDDGRAVRSNVIASQHDLHAEYAGVVPEIASRAHAERISAVIDRALREAGCRLSDIDAVAVGNRPGLIGALLVGVSAAKALAWSLDRPIVGVDHVVAHLYAGLLDDSDWTMESVFPAIGLVVSGGHTAMYELDAPLAIRRVGATIDDAIGEAYDKAATILNLPHPGGPKLDRLAQTGDERAHDFPISRLAPDSLDFSFSGLKTAVLYTVRGNPGKQQGGAPGSFERDASDLTEQQVADVAASFQRAAVSAVILKLERLLERCDVKPRTLLVGGGVSANSRLRAELLALGERNHLSVRLPRMAYCLDNAAMLAGLAHQRHITGDADDLALTASPSSTAGLAT
ncbi:MAG: tRNA (adenosine(37)-N6)-threonylcarbamoyltransferase complex transferase subunit TsaD [Phycisphaerales bacterium]|nr:tRNA (adenosine(37)-N6)-threonylcarbamoyltransferase complex transferase subunit TsaD [Phycisphaerales bacterium]